MKCSLVSLIFLKRSLIFPILLSSSISLHWSLRKAFLSLLAILWNSCYSNSLLFFINSEINNAIKAFWHRMFPIIVNGNHTLNSTLIVFNGDIWLTWLDLFIFLTRKYSNVWILIWRGFWQGNVLINLNLHINVSIDILINCEFC